MAQTIGTLTISKLIPKENSGNIGGRQSPRGYGSTEPEVPAIE